MFHSCAEPQTFPDVPFLLQGLRLNGALPQARSANQLILMVAYKPVSALWWGVSVECLEPVEVGGQRVS